jgi:hypothetical protein
MVGMTLVICGWGISGVDFTAGMREVRFGVPSRIFAVVQGVPGSHITIRSPTRSKLIRVKKRNSLF